MGLHIDGRVIIASGNGQVASGVLSSGPFVRVSASYEHGLALRGEADDEDLSHTVVGWGHNTHGETGAWPPVVDESPYANSVRLLPIDETFYKVTAGEYFSAGLVRDASNSNRDRALKMWGFACIAGTPPTGIYFADDTAHTPTKFIDILAAGHHFIAIIDDGSGTKGYLVSWGYWNYGQPCRMTPSDPGFKGPNAENMVPITSLTQKYIKIVAGHHFDYALREDGVTWDFFGNTEFGVANLPTGTVDIFTGRDHAIGIDANGNLSAWDDPLYPLPDPNLVSFPADEKLWGIARGNSNRFHAALSGCYGNCDRSTVTPILSVNDFICFGDEYSSLAALDPNDPAQLLQQIHSRANGDGSTAHPVLTANDFICFNQAFAEGCP